MRLSHLCFFIFRLLQYIDDIITNLKNKLKLESEEVFSAKSQSLFDTVFIDRWYYVVLFTLSDVKLTHFPNFMYLPTLRNFPYLFIGIEFQKSIFRFSRVLCILLEKCWCTFVMIFFKSGFIYFPLCFVSDINILSVEVCFCCLQSSVPWSIVSLFHWTVP